MYNRTLLIGRIGHDAEAKTDKNQQEYAVVLTEAALPDGKWLDVLHLVRDCPQDPEVIVTDPVADAQFWSEALNLGAYDLLAQPFYEPEVRRILSNACTRVVRRPRSMTAV